MPRLRPLHILIIATRGPLRLIPLSRPKILPYNLPSFLICMRWHRPMHWILCPACAYFLLPTHHIVSLTITTNTTYINNTTPVVAVLFAFPHLPLSLCLSRLFFTVPFGLLHTLYVCFSWWVPMRALNPFVSFLSRPHLNPLHTFPRASRCSRCCVNCVAVSIPVFIFTFSFSCSRYRVRLVARVYSYYLTPAYPSHHRHHPYPSSSHLQYCYKFPPVCVIICKSPSAPRPVCRPPF